MPLSEKQFQPSYGTTVTVTTQKDKDFQKKMRKEQRKSDKNSIINFDYAYRLLGFGENHTGADENRSVGSIQKTISFNVNHENTVYPNVYQISKSSFSGFNTNISLPVGTTRSDSSDQEEIVIPGIAVVQQSLDENLVSIDEFDDWIKPCYKGYKSLNRVQSIVFPIAFKTNENMLVCAPTGAGNFYFI